MKFKCLVNRTLHHTEEDLSLEALQRFVDAIEEVAGRPIIAFKGMPEVYAQVKPYLPLNVPFYVVRREPNTLYGVLEL